jgi:hypothetical protein
VRIGQSRAPTITERRVGSGAVVGSLARALVVSLARGAFCAGLECFVWRVWIVTASVTMPVRLACESAILLRVSRVYVRVGLAAGAVFATYGGTRAPA